MAAKDKLVTEIVRYTGTSDSRSVSVAQFELAEVTDQRSDLVWNSWNGFTVPREDVSDSALEVLLAQDGEFVLEEVAIDDSAEGGDTDDTDRA